MNHGGVCRAAPGFAGSANYMVSLLNIPIQKSQSMLFDYGWIGLPRKLRMASMCRYWWRKSHGISFWDSFGLCAHLIRSQFKPQEAGMANNCWLVGLGPDTQDTLRRQITVLIVDYCFRLVNLFTVLFGLMEWWVLWKSQP